MVSCHSVSFGYPVRFIKSDRNYLLKQGRFSKRRNKYFGWFIQIADPCELIGKTEGLNALKPLTREEIDETPYKVNFKQTRSLDLDREISFDLEKLIDDNR